MDRRTIFVTGGESGIGAACAAAFGALGDRVAIGYHADAAALAKIGPAAVTLAGAEGLPAHAKSVAIRLDAPGQA